MADEPLSVLAAGAESADKNAPTLGDRELLALYETLLLVRELDEQLDGEQERGRIGLWVPAGEAAAIAAGAATALAQADWLYPSFRDWAAYLVRGGSLRRLVAQALGTASDPQHGRQLAGQPVLDGGRYVAPSASLGGALHRAAGTALAMRLRRAECCTVALVGAAAVEQPAFAMALQGVARHRAPLIALVRTPAGSEIDPTARATALGLEIARVEGSDVLAVLKAVRAARERALSDAGATLIEARVAPGAEAPTVDPATLLRPLLEHRGLSDPGRHTELAERCRERVRETVETLLAEPRPDSATLWNDVTAEPAWMIRQAREERGSS